jgi:hypothetical protein
MGDVSELREAVGDDFHVEIERMWNDPPITR